MNARIKSIAVGAVIAALYIVLTVFASGLSMSSGLIQVRFSEALCVLPYFSASAVPGLFVGCLVSNLLIGSEVLDIVVGSLATLAAAVCTYMLGKKRTNTTLFLAPLPSVLINAIAVGWVLVYVYKMEVPYYLACCAVGLGQIIACYALGLPLMYAVKKTALGEYFS